MWKRYAHLRGFRIERKIFSGFFRDEKPDIVHAQGEGIYASLAVNSGYPNVYTIHGLRLKELQMQKSEIGIWRYLLYSRLITQHHRKATNIVAINRYTEKEIEDLHDSRVWMINNAVDECFFGLYSSEETVPGNLLQVGGVRPRKDLITCLTAVKILHDRDVPVKMNIVGPNDQDPLVQVRKYIEEHNLAEVVQIHGLVSAADLDKFYRQADIFVLSSIEESSPIAIVQAMGAGKPIVSTHVGGISEMVEDKKNSFLVDAGDAPALADKIEALILDRDLRCCFSIASRELAVAEWSSKAVAIKTYEMYKEIINEG